MFAVTTAKGPAWDHGSSIRDQARWDEHAAFANGLVDNGVVVLGGPVEDDDVNVVALLAVMATDEQEVRSLFAADPWIEAGILVLASVRSWTMWLGQYPRS